MNMLKRLSIMPEGKMSEIKNAIILAAGFGRRLRPLTYEDPKCLTKINGKPIIENTLEILIKNGIQKTVIVIGYLGDIIKDWIGPKYQGMPISYIRNEIFHRSNSMYSLFLARKYLREGTILIEGDTFFEEALISGVLEQKQNKSYWIVSWFGPEHEGSRSTVDKNGRIKKIEIVKEPVTEFEFNQYKSTGLLKLTPKYGKRFSLWLWEEVKKENINVYFDLVIAKHLSDAAIYIHDVTGLKWADVDKIEDLERIREENLKDNPRKLDYKKLDEFWDRRAEEFGKIRTESIILFEKSDLVLERDKLEKNELAKIEIPKNCKALDLGCGIGRFSSFLAQRSKEVLAIDSSKALLDIAKKENAAPNITYLQSSIINFQGNFFFDFILVSAVLMYIDDKDLSIVIDNLKYMTQKGSLIFLKEPVSLLGKNFEIIDKYSENLKSKYSAIYRKPITYTYAFEEAGFKQISLKKLYQHHQETATMVFLFRRK